MLTGFRRKAKSIGQVSVCLSVCPAWLMSCGSTGRSNDENGGESMEWRIGDGPACFEIRTPRLCRSEAWWKSPGRDDCDLHPSIKMSVCRPINVGFSNRRSDTWARLHVLSIDRPLFHSTKSWGQSSSRSGCRKTWKDGEEDHERLGKLFPTSSGSWSDFITWTTVLCSCSFAVLDPRVGHTMDVLSPFIPVLYHSDWLFHGESCPRLDVVHPGRAWPSSPSCTWHCSLHYLFLQATPLFPYGVTIVCQLPCFDGV